MPVPSVYSAELSEFVFAAGVELMSTSAAPTSCTCRPPTTCSTSTRPGTDGANAFYAMMDRYLGKLDALGATIVLTADHGMNAKTEADGTPDVIYLQDVLDDWLGAGERARDPADHRSLRRASRRARLVRDGLPAGRQSTARRRRARCAALPGIESCCTRAEAARALRAAARSHRRPRRRLRALDRASAPAAARHDLSGLDAPLRSHGGISEQRVPLIVNRSSRGSTPTRRWRNFDAFDLALNHLR